MVVKRKKQAVRFAVVVEIDCPTPLFRELVATARKSLAGSIHIRGADGTLGGYTVKSKKAKRLKNTEEPS